MEEPIVFFLIYGFCFGSALYIAWTHPNWKGTLLSALTLWAFLFLGQVFLLVRYGTGGPAGAMAAIWLLTGWAFSAVFSTLVAAGRKFFYPPNLPLEAPQKP